MQELFEKARSINTMLTTEEFLFGNTGLNVQSARQDFVLVRVLSCEFLGFTASK